MAPKKKGALNEPKEPSQLDVIRQKVRKMTPWGAQPDPDMDDEMQRESMFPGFSPALITASGDTTMRKWNLKTGDCEYVFVGHEGPIMAMQVDFDLWLAVTGSADNTIAMWDIAKCYWRGALYGHEGSVSGLSVDFISMRAVSCSYDHSIKFWDLDASINTRTLIGNHERAKGAHIAAVTNVVVQWPEKKMASCSIDTYAKIWDMETGCETLCLKGHTAPVWCVSLDPDGRQLMTGSADRHVMMWDLRIGECTMAALKHESAVTFCEVEWDSKQMITGSCDRTIAVWDLNANDVISRLTEHAGTVWCASVDWNERRLVSGAGPGDNSIRLWDLRDGYCELEMLGHDSSVWAVAADWERATKAKAELESAFAVDNDDYEEDFTTEELRERRKAVISMQCFFRVLKARKEVRRKRTQRDYFLAAADAERALAQAKADAEEDELVVLARKELEKEGKQGGIGRSKTMAPKSEEQGDESVSRVRTAPPKGLSHLAGGGGTHR